MSSARTVVLLILAVALPACLAMPRFIKEDLSVQGIQTQPDFCGWAHCLMGGVDQVARDHARLLQGMWNLPQLQILASLYTFSSINEVIVKSMLAILILFIAETPSAPPSSW